MSVLNSLFTASSGLVNVDMVLSVVTIFLLIRLQSIFNVSSYILKGIKIFIPKKYSDFVKGAATSTETISIEQALSTLDLSMLEINTSQEVSVLLRIQGFYDRFETLTQFILAAVCAHVITSALHCVFPAQDFSLWVMYLLLTIFYLAVRTMLHMIYFTGVKAMEVRLAIAILVLTMVGLKVMSSFNFPFLPAQTVEAIAIHLNALYVQISTELSALPVSMISMYVKIIYLVVLAIGAMAMVLPAIRLTQTLVKMTLGKPTELAKGLWKPLLWIDFFSPVLLMVVYSPLFAKYVLSDQTAVACDASDSNTCVSRTSFAAEQRLLSIQTGAMVIFFVLKMLSLRQHVQSFMDYSIETVSRMIMSQDAQQRKILHRVVEARTNSLMTTSTQLLTIPAVFFSLFMLMLRSSPSGTGVCSLASGLLSRDTSELLSSVQAAYAYNSTALAFELKAKPHFDIVIWRIAGVLDKDLDGSKLPARTKLIEGFLTKISKIIYLPSAPAISVLQHSIYYLALLCMMVHALCLLIWLVHPDLMKNTIGAQAKKKSS